jgi:hypothetical protein
VVLLLFKRITDTADAQYVQIKSHFESMIKTLNERNEIQNLDTLKKIERSPLLNKDKRQDMAGINDLIIP